MNDPSYLFEKRVLQLFIFPPWGIYRIMSESRLHQQRYFIFLMSWGIGQWLLLVSLGTSIAVSIILSNIAIAMFFLINLYFGLDMNEFSTYDQQRLKNVLLRLLVTAASFITMYSIPRVISKTLSNLDLKFIEFNWTKLQMILAFTLAISWLVFMFIDKYEIFSTFPKTEFKDGLYRLMPVTSEKLASIYLMYILLIVMFFIYG